MTQQVNLYNPALRLPRDWLTAANLALAAVACLGLALLAITASSYRLSEAEEGAVSAAAELAALQGQLTAINARLSAYKPDPVLEREIANATSLLQGRDETLAALADVSIEPGKGFADYLRGFARQSVQGVWLTALTIGPGNELSIHGRTINQSLLSEYVNRLKTEAALAGHSFAEVAINRFDEKLGKTPAGATGNNDAVAQIEFSLAALAGTGAVGTGTATEAAVLPAAQTGGAP